MKKKHLNYKKRCIVAQYMREMKTVGVNVFVYLMNTYDHKDIDSLFAENPDIGKMKLV